VLILLAETPFPLPITGLKMDISGLNAIGVGRCAMQLVEKHSTASDFLIGCVR